MADNRSILVTLIQSATVELFQCYGVATAPVAVPLPLPSKLDQHVGGYGTFVGTDFNGTLCLLVPNDVFFLTKVEGLRFFNVLDWTKELTNQLLGRIKNRLVQYQVFVRGNVPSVIDGKSLEMRVAASRPLVTTVFRTIRGDIVVTISGSIDYSKLHYSGTHTTANEGDIILF
jgi:hypothetical protein